VSRCHAGTKPPLTISGTRLCGEQVKFFIPVTDYYDGTKFFALKADGTPAATPLFVVLVAVELTDFVFAIDNVPVRHHHPVFLHDCVLRCVCVCVCVCVRETEGETERERRSVGGRT
jgi:hypothetical protein